MSAVDSQPSDKPPERPGPPPLRIHHILVCIAVVALLFTMVRILMHSYSADMTYATGADGIVFVVCSGIALTLIGFGFAWRRAQLAFFNQPGHWLLLLYLDAIAHFALAFFDVIMPRNEPPSGLSWMYAIGSTIISLGCVVGTFAAAWLGFQSRWWRAYFLLRGLLYFALPAIALWQQYRGELWAIHNALLLLVLIPAAFTDWRAGRHRDWVNWIGVAITAFTLVRGAVVSLWPWLGSWPN